MNFQYLVRKNHFIFAFFTLLFVTISLSMKLDPSNPPTGQTGAPNETTCSTASGCHNGGAFTGKVNLTGIPDTIAANTTYNLNIELTSSCSRTGFELTVLDKSNAKCGTLIAGSGNNIKTGGTRQYVRQTSAKTMSGGKASYTFQWKSPATIVNDSAYFYFVMLQANGNGGTSGDNVAKGVKKVVLAKTSTTENVLEQNTKIYPNPTADFVNVELPSDQSFNLEITNVAGRSLYQTKTLGSKVLDIRNLPNGQYFLSVIGQNGSFSKVIIKSEK